MLEYNYIIILINTIKKRLQLIFKEISYGIFKLLYGFQLNETSSEMHRDLECFFVYRPVSHFHRLIDVFYRVSVTEQRRDIDFLLMNEVQGFTE